MRVAKKPAKYCETESVDQRFAATRKGEIGMAAIWHAVILVEPISTAGWSSKAGLFLMAIISARKETPAAIDAAYGPVNSSDHPDGARNIAISKLHSKPLLAVIGDAITYI